MVCICKNQIKGFEERCDASESEVLSGIICAAKLKFSDEELCSFIKEAKCDCC
jgi:hypothetical protein